MNSFQVIVPSARVENLVACVRSIVQCEPALSPSRILVIDDGVRRGAEAHLPGVRWVNGVQPFVYARNVNLGIELAQDDDVILLNDDARLLTTGGFEQLSAQTRARPGLGICSAGVRGVVGNPAQLATGRGEYRTEPRTLAFVCVYIPRTVINRLGPLDERFIGYGFDDNDYCARARNTGYELGIWDGCVVDHSGELPSTFRTKADIHGLFEYNRESYLQKWGRVE